MSKIDEVVRILEEVSLKTNKPFNVVFAKAKSMGLFNIHDIIPHMKKEQKHSKMHEKKETKSMKMKEKKMYKRS